MKQIVLDASVALKWFFKERDSTFADEILLEFKKGNLQIFVPQIFFFEIVNAVKTKAKSTHSEGLEVIDKLFSLNFLTEKVDPVLLSKANYYAHKYNLSIYDASYIALAKIKKVVFLTADVKMVRKTGLKFVKSLKDFDDGQR